MSNDKQVRQLIEKNLEQFVSRGVPRKPGDLEACLRYRQRLSLSEQQLFDTLLREGNYAGSAAELIEISAGRERPQSEQFPPVVAKAS